MQAYILVGLMECNEQQVLEDVLSLKEVTEAHILFGEWDLILKLDADSPEAAGTFVMENIRSLPEVKITSTLIVAK